RRPPPRRRPAPPPAARARLGGGAATSRACSWPPLPLPAARQDDLRRAHAHRLARAPVAVRPSRGLALTTPVGRPLLLRRRPRRRRAAGGGQSRTAAAGEVRPRGPRP